MKYRVFADFMCTGIWGPIPGNYETEFPKYVPDNIKDMLESWLVQYEHFTYDEGINPEIMKTFNSYGRFITDELNKLSRDTYIYVES